MGKSIVKQPYFNVRTCFTLQDACIIINEIVALFIRLCLAKNHIAANTPVIGNNRDTFPDPFITYYCTDYFQPFGTDPLLQQLTWYGYLKRVRMLLCVPQKMVTGINQQSICLKNFKVNIRATVKQNFPEIVFMKINLEKTNVITQGITQ